MNDLPFWGLVSLGLVILLAVRWLLIPAAKKITKTAMSRAVIDYILDRERNGWLFLFCFWASVVMHPALAVITLATTSFLGLREFMTRSPANEGDYKSLFAAFFILLPLQYLFVGLGWTDCFRCSFQFMHFLFYPAYRQFRETPVTTLHALQKCNWVSCYACMV